MFMVFVIPSSVYSSSQTEWFGSCLKIIIRYRYDSKTLMTVIWYKNATVFEACYMFRLRDSPLTRFLRCCLHSVPLPPSWCPL